MVSSKNTCLLQGGKAKPLSDAAALALLKSGDRGWEPEGELHCGHVDESEATCRQIAQFAILSGIVYVPDPV